MTGRAEDLARIGSGLGRRFARPTIERISRSIRLRRNRNRDFRPVFVAGAMGSGTSLTALLLGQTFELGALVNESARQIRSSSPLHLDRTERYPTIERYQRAIEPCPSWTPEFVRSELLTLYRSFADGEGDVVVDKGPNTNLTRARLLAASFPTSRFVLVFRDPVANIEGFRRKWPNFANGSLADSISFYRAVHETFLDWASAAGVDPLVVEYERFVLAPDTALERLGEALSLEKTTKPRAFEDRGRDPGGRGIRNVRGSRVSVLRGATQQSVAAVNDADAETIREALGPLHQRMQRAAGGGVVFGE